MYTSTLKNEADIDKIITQSREINAKKGISGVLFYNENTSQVIQLLEGPARVVHDTYRRVCNDDRHYDVKTLLHVGVEKRFFPSAPMRYETFSGRPDNPLEHTLDMMEGLEL